MSGTASPVEIPSGGADPYAALVSAKAPPAAVSGSAFPGQTVQFPNNVPAGAPPRVNTGGPDPMADLMAGRGAQSPNFASRMPPNIPKELMPDIQTLQQFMSGQNGPPNIQALPNPQKAVVMGALGRLLTASAGRLAGGAAASAAVPTAANAKEPADLAKAGLGTGADRVKMQNWDTQAKPFSAPAPPKPPMAEVKAEKPAAPAPKKEDAKPTPTATATAKPNFEKAFAAAVKDPAKPKVFEWNGKKYKVELAQDVKRKGLKTLTSADTSADALNAKELARVKGKA